MLDQPQRIEISRKVITIPKENETMAKSMVLLAAELAKAQSIDAGNKTILDVREPAIDAYQVELAKLNGIVRTVVTEVAIQNAANRVIGNLFYYNQLGVATPSVPDGIWKNFYPFFLGYGIGKNYFEVYPSTTQKEQDLIDAFDAAVIVYEAALPIDQPAALAALIIVVNNYDAFLAAQSAIIYIVDFDTTRQTQSVAAKSNIDTVIRVAISTWLGNTLLLPALKTAVVARKTFIDTVRAPQLLGYLGAVTQNVSNGNILSQSGLYGERASALNLRLSVMAGSLTKVVALTLGGVSQQAFIDSNNANLTAWGLLIKVSKFKAPASANNMVHVMDSSLFAVSDTVFLCGDGQEELTGTILAITGTRIDLSFNVPKKYTPANNSRLYKTI